MEKLEIFVSGNHITVHGNIKTMDQTQTVIDLLIQLAEKYSLIFLESTSIVLRSELVRTIENLKKKDVDVITVTNHKTVDSLMKTLGIKSNWKRDLVNSFKSLFQKKGDVAYV